MKINLAKVIPWSLVLLVVGIIWISVAHSQTGTGGGYDSSNPRVASYADRTKADAYLDTVASHLARPGVWVDPSVRDYSLDAATLSELDARAAKTNGPVRIAVIPATPFVDVGSGTESSFSKCFDQQLGSSSPDWDACRDTTMLDGTSDSLVYDPAELTGLLYDRVGADGTYAVLVDAPSQSQGRGFWADQWAEKGPTYDVGGAADHAVDCCAPDYGDILGAFLDRAGNVHHSPWLVVAWIAGILGAIVFTIVAVRGWLRRRRRVADDREVAEALRPALTEEVIELEQRVGSLPTYTGDPEAPVAVATRRVLDLVEDARHRLDKPSRMDQPEEAEEVTERLAEARYQLTVITALTAGLPAPGRTPPCFFDPRHGPSIDQRPFTPETGKERSVPVCAGCRERLDHQQTPQIRTLTQDGKVVFYWDAGRYSRPYVNGYWQHDVFPIHRVQASRHLPSRAIAFGSGVRSEPAREPVFRFVWEPSSGGGTWGGSGSSGRSWSSSSRRSFGGGSSHRSSHRSGGGRGF